LYQDNNATVSLVAADYISDCQCSSGQPTAAGTSLASQLAITGLLQKRTPSLAQASPFYMVVSSSISIPQSLSQRTKVPNSLTINLSTETLAITCHKDGL
jgi:hypothetical protein